MYAGPPRRIALPDFARLGLALALALAVVLARPAAAQTDQPPADRWQLTLDAEEYLWDVRLVKLTGDTLVVRQSDSLVGVPVGRITEMRLIQKSEMQVGGEGRGAMSALTGGDDEVYDLAALEFAERLRAIQKILLYHPPGDTE